MATTTLFVSTMPQHWASKSMLEIRLLSGSSIHKFYPNRNLILSTLHFTETSLFLYGTLRSTTPLLSRLFIDSKQKLKGQLKTWNVYAWKQWASYPDFPFVEAFFSRRRRVPDEELHLMDPRGLWELWDYLSLHSPLPIPPNPPSSGFIGKSEVNDTGFWYLFHG